MTLKNILEFGDNAAGLYNLNYRILRCHHGVARGYNAFTPENNVSAKDVEVTILATEQNVMNLYSWYINNGTLSGRLSFILPDVTSKSGDTILRTIPFEDAQCVSLKETYDINRNRRRQITLTFTPAKIKIEEIPFTRNAEKAEGNEDENGDDNGDIDMARYNSQYDF